MKHSNITNGEIKSMVDGLEKMITNIEDQKTCLQKSIEMIQNTCNHSSVILSGPYDVCADCGKVMK